MSWVRPYLGVPFDEANCWEICRRALFEQKGLALPDFADRYPRDRVTERDAATSAQIEELILQEAATREWARVERAQPFDVLLLRTAGFVSHCALVVDGQYALSSRPPVGGHLLSFATGLNAQRIAGIYRHAELRSADPAP